MNDILAEKVKAQIIAQATQALEESWSMIVVAMDLVWGKSEDNG